MGLIGSFAYNLFLEKHKKPARYLLIFTISGLFLLSLMILFYYLKDYFWMKIAFGISGFFLVNKVPLIFTFSLEILKIKNVSFLNIILYLGNQLFAIIVQISIGRLFK